MDGFGAAAHAADLALHVQSRDIAPDRRLGSLGQFGNILNRDDRLFLNGAQNDAMTFAFVHGLLLSKAYFVSVTKCQSKTIMNFHIALHNNRF